MPLDLIESEWICLGPVRVESRRDRSEILGEASVTWFVHEGLYARRPRFLTRTRKPNLALLAHRSTKITSVISAFCPVLGLEVSSAGRASRRELRKSVRHVLETPVRIMPVVFGSTV